MNTTHTSDIRTDPEQAGEATLRIGDVAELTGLTHRTIRYYEEVGLLTPPTRTVGDYRLYSDRDVRRLQQIVRLKDLLGFSLGEIRKIVESEEARDQLRSEYHATEDVGVRLAKLDEALALAHSQIALVERKLTQMAELRNELAARIARYEQKKRDLIEARTAHVSPAPKPQRRRAR